MRALNCRLILALAGLTLFATESLAERPALLRCSFQMRDVTPEAHCDIGPAADLARVLRVTWRKETRTGTVDAAYTPFNPGGKAAVLFAADRGDKARAKLVTAMAADMGRLADSVRGVGPGLRIGLAAISDRFDNPVAPGGSRDDFMKALGSLKAEGTIGDTAGGARAAITLLGKAPEDRRILVIGSEGKAEDAAYGSDELIRLAQAQHVTVVGLAWRDATEAPGLIGLRRLAEETGGLLLETAPGARLDDAAVGRFGLYIRSGGSAVFPLDDRDMRGRYVVTAELEGGARLTGTFYADLEGSGAPRAADTPEAPAAATAPPPRPDTPGLADSTGLDKALATLRRVVSANPLLLQLAGLGIVGLGLLSWGARWLRRRSIRAYIQMEDDAGTRIPLRADGVRIGRHSDNDIRFAERSVHRYHAFLFREPDTARYIITDVSRDQARSNGVVVNSEIIKRAELAHGDLVELGEVRFRFLYAGRSTP